MSDDTTSSYESPRRLTVLMRDGKPVLTTVHTNPRADIESAKESIRRLRERALAAEPDGRGQYGYAMFMANRSISRLQDLMEARHAETHGPFWVQDFEGVECTACSCGVLVPGRVRVEFTEAEFRDADGHLLFTDPDQNHTQCPRCGRGLPNDREPGSDTGFWSLTIRRGYVCDGCHDHQMHLGYRPRTLGDEEWPVVVPQRFYDESWWPPRRTGEGGDPNGL